MKISVDENKDLLLEEVFNGVCLKSTNNEKFSICMRDGGYEFKYNNIWYSAKDGNIKELKSNTERDHGNIAVCPV